MMSDYDAMDVDSEAEIVARQKSSGKTYTVGVVWDAVMLSHLDSRQEHQESPARIQRIWDAILKLKYREKMLRLPIRAATEHEILLVHTVDHLDKIKEIATFTEEKIADAAEFYESLSLYVVPATTHCALMSCGGVIEATLAVARGAVKKAFAIVRPPGHHAEPNEHMGFCFLNNVAVAARVVQKVSNIKKVLILDWDVHHGNGTQRAFNDDDTVLYISIHRYDDGTFYPCGPYGSLYSSGEGKGEGFSVNIPWPSPYMGDADYLLAFQKLVMPIAMEFAPDLVIISAGFDAAAGDPLGECLVSPAGYAHMTHMLCGLANGKVVVALEGGYSLDAIERSAMAVTRVLLGDPPEELPPLRASAEGAETIWQVARHQSRFWKNVDPKSCEPRSEVEDISISIPELLKLHRQYDMYTHHKMLQIPLLNSEMESRYLSQVMCSQNLFEAEVLVLFVHEFGNLRLELDSTLVCDVHHERSYLLDISKQLINWIREKDYSLVDVNVFPKPQPPATRAQRKAERQHSVLLYVWDNYVQLSDAKSVVIIAHGPGCEPVLQLLEERTGGVKNLVRSVVQVVGRHKLRRIQDKDDLRRWYPTHSHVILPAEHEMMTEPDKSMRYYGALAPFPETRGVTLILKAFPTIKKIVEEQLDQPFEKVVDIF